MTHSADATAFGSHVNARADAKTDAVSIQLSASDAIARVEVNFGVELPKELMAISAELLSVTVALVVGQGSLAPHIAVHAALPDDAAESVAEIAELLYGSHAYAQRLSNWTSPEIAYVGERRTSQLRPDSGARRRVVLLWSGGKDALASLRVLRLNGYDVLGLHVTANEAVQSLEYDAATALAGAYDLPLTRVNLSWPIVNEILSIWSTSSNVYPLANSVPHGRDLPLLVMGAALAYHTGAAFVAAGYEYDLWSKEIEYGGRVVARHDIQSRKAAVLVDRLLHQCFGIHFFSPIAAFRERAILAHLLEIDLESWNFLSSCFWGKWCGECTKCLRYALTQAVLKVDRIRFQVEPVSDDRAAFSRLLDNIRNDALPFWEQQVYDFFTLHEMDYFRPESRASKVASRNNEWYQDKRQGISEALARRHPDDLAPAGFEWLLG